MLRSESKAQDLPLSISGKEYSETLPCVLALLRVLADEDRHVKNERKRRRFSPVTCRISLIVAHICLDTSIFVARGFAPCDTQR